MEAYPGSSVTELQLLFMCGIPWQRCHSLGLSMPGHCEQSARIQNFSPHVVLLVFAWAGLLSAALTPFPELGSQVTRGGNLPPQQFWEQVELAKS